jgi:Ca2+-binding RTX toxin-like protein
MSSGATRLVEGPGDGFDQVRTSVSYTLAPKAFIETLTTTNIGGTAPINLTGNELAQSIVGNAGSNVLDGKGGNDSLAGSVGPDTFAFSTALGSRNIDVIRDFDPVSDLIRLEDAIFKGLPRGALAADAFRLGTAAQDADDRVIFDAAIGTLYFDPDGTGGLAAQPFATLLGTSVHVSAADFFVV